MVMCPRLLSVSDRVRFTGREHTVLALSGPRVRLVDDAIDAVHEFPFSSPGFPPSFEGREAVRAGYRAAWGASPVQVAEVMRVAAYETADPEVIVAEHVVVGTLPTKATTFTVPGLLILHVRNGLITRVRDHMDGLGVTAARK
ncbi:nuclear transport factor 2 family protein [Streptomyces sp. NPDC058307]|uniref:nuclear transport factor 2 family protein n=1 Tax=Streptomyces sp. NPDC058307 TaxID=3346439 RepID=UPI0036E97919